MASGLLNIGKERGRQLKETDKTPKSGLIAMGRQKNQGGIPGTIGYIAGRAGTDFLRVGEGVVDAALVPIDLLTGNVEQAKSRFMDSPVDAMRERLDREYNPGKVAGFIGDIAGGIGQSVGYGLISAIPYAGTPMMYSSIVEQSISSAAEKTGEVGLKEVGYGATAGAVEGLLESKLGAGVSAAKGIGSAILKKTGINVAESAAKAGGKSLLKTLAIDTAKGFAGEFGEEFVSEAVDPKLQNIWGIDKDARFSLKDSFRAGIIGGISGGAISVGPSVINYKSSVSVGRALQESGLDGDLINRAKYTLSALEAAQTRSTSQIKGKPEGDTKETAKEWLSRTAENRKIKRLSKETKELADKVRKNIAAYEKYRADPKMSNSEPVAALLGELRGNLFLVGYAYEADVIEQVMMDATDEQRQAFVDTVNEELAAQGKKHDYTLADFDANKDDIRRGLAGRLMMDELQGYTTEGGAEDPESPVEPAQAPKDTTDEEVAAQEENAATEATEAAELDPWESIEEIEGYGTQNALEEALLRAASSNGIPKRTVPAMLKSYREGTDLTPAEFAEAWGDGVMFFGRLGLNESAIYKDSPLDRIGENARRASIQEGKTIADEELKRAKEKAEKKKMPARNQADAKRKQEGRGAIVKGKGLIVQDLDAAQYTAYKAAEMLAPVLGTDIVIETDLKTDTGKQINGFYSQKTNGIHINIEAKRNGQSIALYTLGHEVTHYIKAWSPEKFKALSDFVLNQLGDKAPDLIAAKAEFLRKMPDYKDYTITQLNDLAVEEVVADSMELVLSDGKILDELARTEKTVWQKIKDFITKIIADIRKYYGELNQASKTAQVLKETVDSLDEIEQLFYEGVTEAGERSRTAGVEAVTRMNEENMHDSDRVYSSPDTRSQEMLDFYDSVLKMKDRVSMSKRQKKLGAVSASHAKLVSETIKKETGKDIDLSGYELWIDGSAVEHIEKRHGKNGKADHSMKDREDIARIPWVANAADQAIVMKKDNGEFDMDSQYKNSDMSPSYKVKLSYKIGEATYYVTECVPDSESKKMHIVSAYIEKGSKGQELDMDSNESPQLTSETLLNSNATKDSIAQTDDSVNISDENSAENSSDTRYSIDEDSDTAYLAAVERGDMETAQRMVDEAAKKAGYTVKAYHGTPINGIRVFDNKKIGSTTDEGLFGNGFYFSTNKLTADGYATERGATMPVYLKVNKPWWGNAHNDISQVAEEIGVDKSTLTTRKAGKRSTVVAPLASYARTFTAHLSENGYDSVVVQHGAYDYEIVIFNNKSIKSADPVTYDDNGNVIPLSERFKEDNPDIRYSIDETPETPDVSDSAAETNVGSKTVEELEAENKRLTEKVQRMSFERFRRAVKDGEIEAKKQRQALSKGADAVLDSIGVHDGRNRRELLRRMSETYAHMAAEKGITYEAAFEESGEIAKWLISRQPLVRDAAMAEQAKETINTLRGTKIRLTYAQKMEVANTLGSSDEYRKAMFGRITVSDKDGVPLDVQWEEWADQYPDLFDKDTPEADMPERLREIYDSLADMRDRVETVDEYIDETALTATIFSQIGQIGYGAEAAPFNDRAILADMLSGAAVSEHEYKIIKDYKAASDELADNDRRLAELRRETAELNREIKVLQDKLRGVDKTKREPWVMTALTDAIKRKGELMDEMDALAAKIKKADERFFSLRAAAPVRRAMNELNKKIKAEEKRAERAEAKAEQAKEKYEAEAEYQSNRREMSVRERIARRVVGRMNTMFYNPTKTKHVPADLQALVEEVLKSEKLDTFKETRKNLRQMAEMESEIEKLEQNPARTAKEQETLDKLHYKYAMFEDEGMDAKSQAVALYTAFEEWMERRPPDLQDKALLEQMSDDIDAMQDMPLSVMSMKSLEAVEHFYKEIYHQVNTANQAFATEKTASIDQMSTKANTQVKNAKELKFLSPRAGEWAGLAGARSYLWKNMKPLTVFEAIGSDELMSIFKRVLDGEDVWITDILEAKQVLDEAKKEHGYNKWNLQERREVTTADGSKVSLTLGEMMSLYAYNFREQAEEHLSVGGFVFAPDAKTVEKFKGTKALYQTHLNDQTPHRMRKQDIDKMSEMLTEEQRAYAKTVQKYLTSLGEKGNKVSQKLYGIDLFKETAYFPIKSSHDYIETQTGKSGDPNIKSRGTFKETVPKAGNPIVLQDFMEVVGDHVNTMAIYHAFVLPVEDLTRVWNYTPVNIKRDENGKAILDKDGMPVADTEGEAGYNSLKAEITKKYGKEANDYILQLLRDLNGGARRESAASILDKGLTAFKRSATMLSLSTIVQQPTSILRAMAYVDAKHFTGAGFVPWETVKKYAPVAAIKEMGGFDTGTGARTAEYINAKQYDSIKDAAKAAVKPEIYGGDPNVRAEAFGWLTSKADEVSWRYMFGAIVNEQAEKLGKPKDSEEVLKAAGERFAEVVRRTQVYDSTLTRSEYMRSKDGLMKMATAFGAEPTTVVSMVVDAIIKAERGDKTFLRKSAAGIAFSVIANAAVASLIYAMRDDDEDETIPEKYAQSLTSELIEGFNPLEYLPIARDIMSMFKGYEIERSDMALIGNLMEQVELITSSKRSVQDKIFGVTGAVSAFFGLPVTNVYRDLKGLWKTGQSITNAEEQTGAGLGHAMGDAVRGQFNLFSKLFGAESGNAYELYTAYVRGDTAHYERVKARYKTPQAAEMALRTELRDNDKRIPEAAQARLSGDLAVYESLVDQIESEGIFDRGIVIRAINNEMLDLKDEDTSKLVPKDETVTDEEETAESLYKASDLNNALERGDTEDFAVIMSALVEDKVSAGKTEAQARASAKSSVTAYWKKLYVEAWSRGDTEERKRIIAILTETGLYGSRNDVATLAQNWVKNSK